jgi:predicted nucleic acid-binding protein
MLVVADSSALLALASCEGLSLLDSLFEDVRVPSAVFAECTVAERPYSGELRLYLEGRVDSVDLSAYVIAAIGLGSGELEAMALYKHLGANRLLLDDERARRVARVNHIEVVGSVGVLLLAKDRSLIATVRPRLDSMESAGIYLSKAIYQAALEFAGEA